MKVLKSKLASWLALSSLVVFTPFANAGEFSPYLVKDLRSGSSGSAPIELIALGNKVLFGSNVEGLWQSDGSEAGTSLVKELGIFSGTQINNMTVLGNKVIFSTTSELWATDGTEMGTIQLTDSLGGPVSGIFSVNNKALVLVFNSTANEFNIWESDGTVSGTQIIKTISNVSHPNTDGDRTPKQALGAVFFVVNEATYGQELWVTDGTELGTQIVADIRTGSTGAEPRDLTAGDGVMYFTANDGIHDRRVWKTDGTEFGTEIVYDGSAPGGDDPEELFFHNGILYFSADEGGFDREPWVSDGSAMGTQMLKNIAVSPDPILSSFPSNFRVFGNVVYFSSSEGIHKTDGTESGTLPVSLTYGIGSAAVEFNEKVYASSNVSGSGIELVVTDLALETQYVEDIRVGSAGSEPSELTVVGDTLFFSANDGLTGSELWAVSLSQRVIRVAQTQAYVDSISFSATLNTSFDNVNMYAVCHTAGTEFDPTPADIQAGRVDSVTSAISSIQSFGQLPNAAISLNCGSLAAATAYAVYVVFEDADNPGQFSTVFNAPTSLFRTAPEIETLSLVSAEPRRLNLEATLQFAQTDANLKLYYACDDTLASPTVQNVLAGQISEGVSANYASSRTISKASIQGSTTYTQQFPCIGLDEGSNYYIYAVLHDTAFEESGLSDVSTSQLFGTLGVIDFGSQLLSTTDSQVQIQLADLITQAPVVNVYAVCHAGEVLSTPAASDIKAGRIDSLRMATSSVSMPNLNTQNSPSFVCPNLPESSNLAIFVVFERMDMPGAFSEVKDLSSFGWRTAPKVFEVDSVQVGNNYLEATVSINLTAQTEGINILWICDESSLIPTPAQIRASLNGAGQGARFSNSRRENYPNAVEASEFEVTLNCTGLDAGKMYWLHAFAEDDNVLYRPIDSHQAEPISALGTTISKIDSISQSGMSESEMNLVFDSVSTNFNRVNAYVICVEDGLAVTPSASDIKAGRIDGINQALASAAILDLVPNVDTLEVSCASPVMSAASKFDVFAVLENQESPGEFSSIYADTYSEWRTSPVVIFDESQEADGQTLLFTYRVLSAASVSDLRVHSVCDKAGLSPSSEDVIAGRINDSEFAYSSMSFDLPGFSEANSSDQFTINCEAPAGEAYAVYLVAEDLGFVDRSYQNFPSTSQGIVIEDDFCLPISSESNVVLVCL